MPASSRKPQILLKSTVTMRFSPAITELPPLIRPSTIGGGTYFWKASRIAVARIVAASRASSSARFLRRTAWWSRALSMVTFTRSGSKGLVR